MRILVNYNPQDDNYKNVIAQLLSNKGLQAVATNRTFTIMELQEVSKKAKCDGILLANEATLQNCVNSSHKVTLDKYRGSRLNFTIPAIVGAPLRHLRINKHGRWLYEKDLDKFKNIKKQVSILQFLVCDSIQRLETLLRQAAASLIVSMDIETDSNNRITCVSFTLLTTQFTTKTFVIPFIDFGVDHYVDDELYSFAIRTMQRVCALDQPKLFFNGGYDALMLIAYHCEPNNFVLDSMALAHCEYSELPKTLDAVSSYHLYDYYFWKDEADDSRKKGNIQGYWAYCARDSWNTLRCFLSQIRNAKPYAFRNYQMLFKMFYPYMYCAYEGLAIDESKRLENRIKAQGIVDALKQDLCTMADDPDFNPNSPKQTAHLLFDVIGAKAIRKRKRNKDGAYEMKISTDEDTLKKIATQHPLIALFIDKILEYRGETKAISTYFDFVQHCGRMLYGIDPFGTETGRAASRQSSFRIYDTSEPVVSKRIKNLGAQAQNIPSYAKNMLIADTVESGLVTEEYELCEADNNKSEARCVAELSNCPGLQQALSDKEKDFYRVLGTIFFGLQYADVTTELRNKVLKRVVHGRNYLMGVEVFITKVGYKQIYEGAKLLNMVIGEGGNFKTVQDFVGYLLKLYNKPFPELEDWYNSLKLEIMRNGTRVSPMGYTRHFFGDIMKDHAVFRGAVAHEPQNLSVIILNEGVWNVYTKIVLTHSGEFRLKAQIHDSILSQFPTRRRDYYKPLILKCMDNPVKMVISNRVLTIPVDINTGRSWLDLKT